MAKFDSLQVQFQGNTNIQEIFNSTSIPVTSKKQYLIFLQGTFCYFAALHLRKEVYFRFVLEKESFSLSIVVGHKYQKYEERNGIHKFYLSYNVCLFRQFTVLDFLSHIYIYIPNSNRFWLLYIDVQKLCGSFVQLFVCVFVCVSVYESTHFCFSLGVFHCNNT